MSQTRIGVVGAGGMGSGISRRLSAAGHSVVVTDSTPSKADAVASGADAGQPGKVRSGSVEDAVAADIVVLALWYPGTLEFAKAHAHALAGKIVVDISNPLDSTYTRLTVAPTTSAAEELARALQQTHVVKAFNTVPAPTLAAAEVDGMSLDTFIAGDDAGAKAQVVAALEGSGLRAIDAGTLDNSRLLERLTAFGIELGQRYGLGFDFGFKYLPTRDLSLPS